MSVSGLTTRIPQLEPIVIKNEIGRNDIPRLRAVLLTYSSYKPVLYNEIIRKIKLLPKRSIPLGIRDLDLTREDL